MSSKIKSEHLLLCFFPLFTFYFPTVRLGSVPIRFEDIICIVLMFLVILNSKSTNNKVNIGIVFSFLIMLITLFFSTNYYNLIGVTINFNSWS
jgi:dolichol kinase